MQLIVIGGTYVMVHNDIITGEFDCGEEVISEWWGMVFPLATFATEISEDIDIYCDNINN